jgi:uncharacterized protein YihD (DUF1040 family)
MGYRCPVCGDPQADDVHLANHLAFTAMVRGGDHESWLDDNVPDWANHDDESLAEIVSDLAESAEYPQVFEDTTDAVDHDDHSHDDQSRHESLPGGATPAEDPGLDEEAKDILSEAREMTRERRDADENEGDESDQS